MVELHIGRGVEVYRIIDVVTNMNYVHHPFPFHHNLLYPFHYDQVVLIHILQFFLEFEHHRRNYRCGLDVLPSFLVEVLIHNLHIKEAHPLEEEHHSLLVIHDLKVDHSLGFLRISLEVGID
jgi:hypothetical protein